MKLYPKKPKSVYFFGTCIVDLLYPEVGLASINILQREGLEVIFPQKQTCCGQPAFNSGFHKESLKVASNQINLFTKEIPIIIPSGSCGGMIRNHFAELFKKDLLEKEAQSFANRTFELTEFLVNVLKIKLEDKGSPIKTTWHSSCHAKREMGIGDSPKELLGQLKNVELVDLKREEECCGFGGAFSIKEKHISASMVKDKVDDIIKTEADLLLGGDCGCLLNISGALKHSGNNIKYLHIAEFIWQRTNISKN